MNATQQHIRKGLVNQQQDSTVSELSSMKTSKEPEHARNTPNHPLVSADLVRQIVHNSLVDMRKKVILNASYHGIDLNPGVENRADGDCLFETVTDSINTRECFTQKIDEDTSQLRVKWLSEAEELSFDYSNYGLEKHEWKLQWEQLKKPKVYEHEMADLIAPAIAHCVKKDLLIFNVHSTAFSPVYVVSANTLDSMSVADTDIPVCLGYNGVHYEEVVPNSEEDIRKTVLLKKKFIDGDFNVTMNEMNEYFKKRKATEKHLEPAMQGELCTKPSPKLRPKDMNPEQLKEHKINLKMMRKEKKKKIATSDENESSESESTSGESLILMSHIHQYK